MSQDSIVTVGAFDGVHVGHRLIIAELVRLADELSLHPVVLTFERHPRQVLGDGSFAQLTTPARREVLIHSLGDVEVVTMPFSRETAMLPACRFFDEVLYDGLSARALLLGYDNRFGSRSNDDFDMLERHVAERGVKFFCAKSVEVDGEAVSSSRVRRALFSGEVQLASKLLGRPYSLYGCVVHGRHKGGEIGFPTANVMVDDRLAQIPRYGVYAVDVFDEDGVRLARGMANLGPQPTFDSFTSVLEVHLIDFDGFLYGRRLRIDFLQRLRDNRYFDNVEALRFQLEKDRDVARRINPFIDDTL